MTQDNTNTEIAVATVNPYLPAMNIQQVIERRNAVVQFVKSAMVEGVDYGVIPGTQKPTLYKPGAEKLNTLFGLTTRFAVISQTEDWTGKDFNGEPFFSYDYRCQLWRGSLLIAESDGSANSFEKKYRYRDAQRKCPNCGKPAIIKGKEEYGGGWICFAKKGGCGSKFMDNAPEIVNQTTGQVSNPDICDMPNTLRKMAQKRAFVGTTLIAVNASEFFTQDIEDMNFGYVIDSTARTVDKPDAKQPAPAPQNSAQQQARNRAAQRGSVDSSRGDKPFGGTGKAPAQPAGNDTAPSDSDGPPWSIVPVSADNRAGVSSLQTSIDHGELNDEVKLKKAVGFVKAQLEVRGMEISLVKARLKPNATALTFVKLATALMVDYDQTAPVLEAQPA